MDTTPASTLHREDCPYSSITPKVTQALAECDIIVMKVSTMTGRNLHQEETFKIANVQYA